MNLRQLAMLIALAATPTLSVTAESATCRRTIPSGEYEGPVPPWPGTRWYGGDSLAVMLPTDGVWPTTKAGHLIAIKLFWFSRGFQPGMEEDLRVQVVNFDEQGGEVRTVKATNAHAESLGGWAMLTGIDFPQPGCWRISASYRNEELSFTVKVIGADEWISSRTVAPSR